MLNYNKMLLASRMLAAAVAALLIFSVQSHSQVVKVTAGELSKVGLSGGQFLKIGVGARAGGMAGAYSGIATDASAIFWNSAGVAFVDGYAVDFSQTFWFAGMSHSFAAGIIPLSDKFRIAASFTAFSSGDVEITTTGQPDGTGGIYNVSDVAFGLTLAGKLTDQFSFGVTGRAINQAFSNLSATGFVFDIGTRYETGFNGVVIGFTVNNLGSQLAYDGADVTRTNQAIKGVDQTAIDMQIQTSSYNVPLSFRAGLGIDMFKGIVADAPETADDGTDIHQWIVGADFETFSDVREQFAIGTEYTFREFISVRAGYRFGQDQFGASGGIGLKYVTGDFKGKLDYSITPTQTLGLINRVSVAINFE
ncbi:MAG: PorV/PorQ family protein [Ignavibacteria bacterium]|nr:PorV/PorQ family protein [Ignavibacteria bacterium]